MDRRLLVATTNRGKLREIKSGFRELRIDLQTLPSPSDYEAPEETGTTFKENALLKAAAAFDHFGGAILSEDSGLEVEALDWRPGIHSARYGGEGLDDRGRNRLLLEELTAVPEEKRSARFVCVMILMYGKGQYLESRGEVYGRILDRPRGENGFGYDPVFYHEELQKTFAELTELEKNRMSHRGLAAFHLAPELSRLLESV